MTDLAVIIPSWDIERALTRVRELMKLERRKRAEYILVVPDAESAKEVDDSGFMDAEFLGWYRGEGKHLIKWITTADYLSPVEAMAEAGKFLLAQERGVGHSPSDVFVFLHDDVLIEQRGWDRAILDHFAAHPRCGLVGFGGGIGFADIDIYKVPYDYRQLARVDFVSNMREAESHGRRVTEPVRVAALDGFSMITTREFYTKQGPSWSDLSYWQGKGQTPGLWDQCAIDGVWFHMNDAWISCRAAEMGYETWMLPVACHHQGGQTSVGRQTEYAQVVRRLGFADAQDLYDQAHRRVYERFALVLPIRVPNTDTKEIK